MEDLTKIRGLYSSADVIFTDETCRTIDEDACREVWRYLLKCGVSAIMTNEEPHCLTLKERNRLTKICVDEVKGKVPIIEYVWADSTQGLIEQGLNAKEHGAVGLLTGPPNIVGGTLGEDGSTAGEFAIEHFSKFSKETKMPLILMAGPDATKGQCWYLPKNVLVDIAKNVESLLGFKFLAFNDALFKELTQAIKAVRKDILCLRAGSLDLFGVFSAGGDGCLSGQLALAEEDCQIFDAFRSGDLKKAEEINKRTVALAGSMYGFGLNWYFAYFEYRFKVAAWLMGLIPRPYMRRPFLPPPLNQIEMIRDFLIKAGKPVVREPKQLPISDV
jgi:4-hydroxy-tetrahydrodipicolinate synthase